MVEVKQVSEDVVLGDFDIKITKTTDPLTKRVVSFKPYTLHCVGQARYFEYPKGSGNLWWESREFCGRWEDGKAVVGKAHVAFKPPLTEDEALAKHVAGVEDQNKKLLAELEAIKKERAAKIGAPSVAGKAKDA
jgi:hypothetical protein